MRFSPPSPHRNDVNPRGPSYLAALPRYEGPRLNGARDAMFRLPEPEPDRSLAATRGRRRLEHRSRAWSCPASTASGVQMCLVPPATARGSPSPRRVNARFRPVRVHPPVFCPPAGSAMGRHMPHRGQRHAFCLISTTRRERDRYVGVTYANRGANGPFELWRKNE